MIWGAIPSQGERHGMPPAEVGGVHDPRFILASFSSMLARVVREDCFDAGRRLFQGVNASLQLLRR